MKPQPRYQPGERNQVHQALMGGIEKSRFCVCQNTESSK